MSNYTEDDNASGGYVFGSAPPMPRQPAWDAPQAHQSSTPHPTLPLRADGTPWTFRTAELRAHVTPEAQPMRRSVRGQRRFRAVLWDPICCSAVFLGSFDTQEERDAAVNEGKARRALGLFVRP